MALVAGSLASTLFLFAPANVYYSNSLEFPFRFRDALPYLCLLASAATLVLTGVACLVRSVWRRRIVSVLLGLALLSWAQGNLLTWDYGRLDGREIMWTAYGWRSWVDATVWVGVLGLSALGWRIVWPHARDAAVALLAVQVIGTSVLAWRSGDSPSYVRRRVDDNLKYRLSSQRDVVILLLDGLQSPAFARMLADDPALASRLDGFTYFRNAVADFPITQASVPAILTARRYDNSTSYSRFIEQAYSSSSSLPKVLREYGFLVDVYGLSKSFWSDPSVLSNLEPGSVGLRFIGGNVTFLVDLGLFRSVPHQLKRIVYADNAWLTLRLAPRLGWGQQTPLAVAGITPNVGFSEELRARAPSAALVTDPIFKFWHLQGPHPPFSIDEDGMPAQLPPGEDGYRKAVAGSIRLATRLLDVLRERGVYEQSMIWLISDHGLDFPLSMPAGLATRVGSHEATAHLRALPLILVKPLGAQGTLRVSDAPVQLSDIPRTVFSQLGIPVKRAPGADMFDLDEHARRERLHYCLIDTNWVAGTRLSAMTEYAVDGFSWFAQSWRATGLLLGDYRDALKSYRVLTRLPELGPLSAWSSSGDDPVMYVTNDGELMASFPPSLQDPRRGDFAIVSLPFNGLERGRRYRLAFTLSDQYPNDFPGRLVQMAWFDDRLVYVNDLGAGTAAGPREVEWRFTASTGESTLRVEMRAVGDPEPGWGWGRVAGIALGRLRLDRGGTERPERRP